MRTFLLSAALLSLFATSPSRAEDAPNAGIESFRLHAGKFGMRIFESATSVEVYRIQSHTEDKETPETIYGYKILRRAEDQGAEVTGRLRQAVLEGQVAPDGKDKQCPFEPGVVFRFVSGKEHADLFVCFKCNELRLWSTDPKSADTRYAEVAFDDYRATLLRLARDVFSDDAEIGKSEAWPREDDKAVSDKLGAHMTHVLKKGNKVEVFRIKPDKGDPAAAEKQIEGYPIISQGPDRGPAFANRIASQMLSGRTRLGGPKKCKFSPGVALRISGPEGSATLLLCFDCDDILAVTFPPQAPNKLECFLSLDGGREGWLEIAQQGLPGDAEIQALENPHK